MGRLVSIENEIKKYYGFFEKQGISSCMNKNEKRIFKRMCSKFKIIDGNLFYKLNGSYKRFRCKYENDQIKEIISASHSLDHVGPRETYERISKTYCGICYEDVIEHISNCENCMRERPPTYDNSVTPIIPSYKRERLIIDTIDMSSYSDHNENYKYIFIFIDSFSKFAWAYQQKEKMQLHFRIF
ncbi:Pro-Pol polyprotein [Dictyocoela muelleri]|nr:Pro-Pol polyprotein [Dictyocoela muelleri]